MPDKVEKKGPSPEQIAAYDKEMAAIKAAHEANLKASGL